MSDRYQPPGFALYEFDTAPQEPGRRWLSGWNGLVGRPAEQVTLAWAADGMSVLVAASDRAEDPEGARRSAAHLALGGDELPVAARPDRPAAVHREIQRIAGSPGLWYPGPPVVPGGPPADLAVLDGYVLAVSQAGTEQVLVAAAGLAAEQVGVRLVRDWAAYDLDASRPHSLRELNRALERRRPGGGTR